MRYLLVALIGVAFLVAPAASAASFSTPPEASAAHGKQTKKLKRELAKMRRSRARWRDRAWNAEDHLDTLRAANTDLAAQVTSLGTQVAGLQAENAALRAGIPDAIKAVPLDQFLSLVIIPARDTWPCDSTYTSGGYWSIDFQSMSFC